MFFKSLPFDLRKIRHYWKLGDQKSINEIKVRNHFTRPEFVDSQAIDFLVK
ncbi:hypothetical protein C943_03075 [Mariniradius saccharolyticus AK6]|uniref:Uncharacterized protein n=1 Tax=Mariniradius saccharolyticus AK6 TaxID=1239962 RepID=M7X059_9BACT|nr:hypothetical protein C943_03075 [Mariniradius saccharolyticus AK6]